MAITSSAVMSSITSCRPSKIETKPAKQSRLRLAVCSAAITPCLTTIRYAAAYVVDTGHGWCWEVQSVQEVGQTVVVTGRLTIPTADGDLLHYSAVASEPLESKSHTPAPEVAASSCLRRAAALAGLGLELWG